MNRDLAHLVVGLCLLGFALPTQLYVTAKMRGWPVRLRRRVTGIPGLLSLGFLITTWVTVGLTWWCVPVALAITAAAQLVALRSYHGDMSLRRL